MQSVGDRFRLKLFGLVSLMSLSGCGSSASDKPASGVGGNTTTASGGHSASSGGNTSINPGSAGASSAGSAGSGGVAARPTAVDCRADGDGKTTLVFINGCAAPVTYRGSEIEGGTLEPGAFACVDIGSDTESLSAKRYWGFLGQDPGAEHHTLAEFTFNTDFYDFDWYNISHVDAHNLPLQIEPLARPACDTLTCAESWLESCPPVGQLRDNTGKVIACVSPDRNNPDSPVAQFFEACDDAYAWSGDDQFGDDPSPVRACAGEDWNIVFCPGTAP